MSAPAAAAAAAAAAASRNNSSKSPTNNSNNSKSPADHAEGRQLRFLANVDPIDVRRALDGLDPAETLIVIISKTFTTAETMLNARTVKQWLVARLGAASVSDHFCAASTALDKTAAFGIDRSRVFGFWDWVGGRFSVCSAVGLLPLSLQYGPPVVERFLRGARAMDKHFFTQRNNPSGNLPMILGALAYFNLTFGNVQGIALLPYCQALHKFAPHVQQLDMESNGKTVRQSGAPAGCPTGGLYFGEPGTNGQHSFYQLLHQGTRSVACEFIGFKMSQYPIGKGEVMSRVKGDFSAEPVSNHDELMSNFFAQADALAFGKPLSEVESENAGRPELVPHRSFSGNRLALQLLMPRLTPYWLGALLALYEHRTAVQGWLWGVNSFDQWGVELGKVLGSGIRSEFQKGRAGKPFGDDEKDEKDEKKKKVMQPSTKRLLSEYLRK